MEQYAEKVQQILEKLISEDNQQSRSWLVNLGCSTEEFNLKPFFFVPSLHARMTMKIRDRLEECGWKDEVQLECLQVIKRRGLDNVEVEDVVKEVLPSARAKLPVELKRELVAMLKDALMKELDEGKA